MRKNKREKRKKKTLLVYLLLLPFLPFFSSFNFDRHGILTPREGGIRVPTADVVSVDPPP
ncbi:hypothetical protein BDV23DRAFT_145499 [Aspergillus alliaceus]|uniref:Uncharacterized protein n=1 Tax=Petromyces alliaceus TaxID=209559 RepID=A0A5N7CM35_PETAA|nr:hypothetical protein BDV23DRAFT_145499 [Aspergillus alliaceus]